MSRRTRVMTSVVALLLLLPSGATAAGAEGDAFARTWTRTDQPVASGEVARTWVWGPQSFADEMEEYAESPGGMRAVRYFDKSRMEVTHPDAPDDGLWYVTNGLLVVELITGRMQVGDDAFVQRLPAEINVAGDQGFANGPTYATFRPLVEPYPEPEDRGAALVIERIDAAGLVTTDDTLAGQGVRLGFYDDITSHNIAAPFWDFMNAEGLIEAGGELTVERLFANPYYATGRPITEPYWSNVVVAGTEQLVLIQCFERRCLTYTPGNEPGWRVEAGNVGRHYHQWRYAEAPEVAGQVLFYRRDAAGMIDLFLINANGANERNLTADFEPHVGLARWSPDGSQIAFLATPPSSTDQATALFIMAADGSNLREIARDVWEFDWSPDGTRFAFARSLGTYDVQIFVMDADGANVRQLTDIPSLDPPVIHPLSASRDPDWSPDGQRIAFTSATRVDPLWSPSAVFVVDADGTNLTELLPDNQPYMTPTWSPDGRLILAWTPQVGGRDLGGTAIYSVNPDVGSPSLVRVIGEDASFPSPPVWAPDGEWIATALTPIAVTPTNGRVRGTPGIHLIDPSMLARTQITHYGVGPAWSPDGSYLTFTLESDLWTQVEPRMVVATDIKGQTQWIVTSDGWGAQWQPGAPGS